MDYVYVGKIVNTHGIKGEIRILSDFSFKQRVFKINNSIFIGNMKEEKIINSYRKHKNFDMVTLKGINNINDVLRFKGMNVYFKKEDLNLKNNEILEEELIGLSCIFNDKVFGNVTKIINNNGYKIISIENILVPYDNNFIKSIDIKNNKIIFKNIEELIK